MKELAKKEVEDRSLDVLHFLNLGIKKNNTPIAEQLEMVLKMYKYVVQNIKPISSFGIAEQASSEEVSSSASSSDDKKRFAFEKLRQALISNPGDSASNVILLNYLLYLKGFKSCIVLSESRNQKGEGHLSNLIEVGKDDWYFFDPSLERINFVEDQFGNPDEFSYNWAGLGMNYYSRFYRPIAALKEVGAEERPISSFNVSDEPILREVVESVGKRIPDLSYEPKISTQSEPSEKTYENKEKGRDE